MRGARASRAAKDNRSHHCGHLGAGARSRHTPHSLLRVFKAPCPFTSRLSRATGLAFSANCPPPRLSHVSMPLARFLGPPRPWVTAASCAPLCDNPHHTVCASLAPSPGPDRLLEAKGHDFRVPNTGEPRVSYVSAEVSLPTVHPT